MKRFIAVLLVMGVIMTAFATSSGSAGSVNITNSATDAASTDVVLNLNQNAGKVWFSAGDGAYSNISTYYLSLPAITALNQSPSGNDNWVATGTDLVLNWNIISCNSVKIELEISGKLEGAHTTPESPVTIGWKLSYKKTAYTGTTGTSDSSDTVISAGYPDTTDKTIAVAITKDNVIYGSCGSLDIEKIVTENTYGKKVDVYTATLTAKVTTTN